jgi:hypothetical protein
MATLVAVRECDSLYVGYLKKMMTERQAAVRDSFGTCPN